MLFSFEHYCIVVIVLSWRWCFLMFFFEIIFFEKIVAVDGQTLLIGDDFKKKEVDF